MRKVLSSPSGRRPLARWDQQGRHGDLGTPLVTDHATCRRPPHFFEKVSRPDRPLRRSPPIPRPAAWTPGIRASEGP
ncbi:MAG: hypothetical protein MZV63_13500 [Marinilabiliales bacterium]|nr:hypothetical protein [Marinilabiliales bacterium]